MKYINIMSLILINSFLYAHSQTISTNSHGAEGTFLDMQSQVYKEVQKKIEKYGDQISFVDFDPDTGKYTIGVKKNSGNINTLSINKENMIKEILSPIKNGKIDSLSIQDKVNITTTKYSHNDLISASKLIRDFTGFPVLFNDSKACLILFVYGADQYAGQRLNSTKILKKNGISEDIICK